MCFECSPICRTDCGVLVFRSTHQQTDFPLVVLEQRIVMKVRSLIVAVFCTGIVGSPSRARRLWRRIGKSRDWRKLQRGQVFRDYVLDTGTE